LLVLYANPIDQDGPNSEDPSIKDKGKGPASGDSSNSGDDSDDTSNKDIKGKGIYYI